MVGLYRVLVQNKFITYDFEVKRKYTIIRGDSGTGKTYLCSMLSDSTVRRECAVNISVLPIDNWDIILKSVSNQIFVVDESHPKLTTNEFASVLKYSNNYFILITRNMLSGIPYSVSEIYTLSTSPNKYKSLDRPFNTTVLIPYYKDDFINVDKPDLIICEDSNSGYQFFTAVTKNTGTKCVSAKSKDNIVAMIGSVLSQHYYDSICCIVDGAAFGCCVSELFSLYANLIINRKIVVLVPESFEYLILKYFANRGTLCRTDYLDYTYKYHDLEHLKEICFLSDTESEPINSWEQFYTRLLCRLTYKTNYQYTKSSLNKFYLRDNIMRSILAQLPELSL